MRLTVLIWTVTCLAWQIPQGESNVIVSKVLLHHRMTREEMKHFFGVEHPQDVPEYNVVLPYEADKEGDFASFSLSPLRRKRSPDEDEDGTSAYYYKIDALGEKLHLHVKRNTKFMAPGLQLETRDQYGRPIRRAVSKTTYLTGKVVSDPGSLVALSVSDGMTGFVRRSCDTFVVHPLPAHLAGHVRREEGATPHLVYNTPERHSVTCETDKEAKSAKRDIIQNQLEDLDDVNRGLNNKYLEVALLADERLVATHGNNTEEFLLLIASIADSIFQGPTAGDIKINYVVTRLVFITNQELGVDPSDSRVSHKNVTKKLAAWARKNNKINESDPLQFDVASLIRSAGVGGLAAVYNKVCYHKDLVNVNSDNGLQTAYTIAHETAHNLHLDHDGKACPNHVNIMSSTLAGGPQALEWSSCSKDTLQAFLSSNDSSCLNDLPPSTRPKPPASFYTKLPGELVDADTQCEYQYGPGYRRCPQRESNCDATYCTPDGYTCHSRGLRPLEGTACGSEKWCIRGLCVDNALPKTDGGWSEWSNYTDCSRSCGGGVRYRKRTCTNPPPQKGGEDCAGPSKDYWEICNSNVECPQSQTTFRDQQCKQIDSSRTAYYVKGANPCRLACQSGSSYGFYGNVVDGTRCDYADTSIYDVCIEGQCQKVGCDHVLRSGKIHDRCGVCDGIGDSCTDEKSTYTKSLPKYGYRAIDTITVLPVNTTHALFKERSATYNLFGVQDENGNNLIPIPSWWGKVIYKAGTKITYINDAYYPDRLEITGPTTMILKIVYVQVHQKNVGIEYHYLRPLQGNETREPPVTCRWSTADWTVCFSGRQTREIFCLRSDNYPGNTNVSLACCDAQTKPDAVKLCPLNVHYSWFTEWETCSKTCGKGSQSQSVVCRGKVNATHYKTDESEASCNQTLKPENKSRYCNNVRCPAKWKTSWSECSTVCLPGYKTGNVKCSRTNELGETEDVSDIQCEYEPRPPITKPCNENRSSDPCRVYEIGCFITPPGLFSETLGDFRQEPNSTFALAQCKELTRRKSYTVFALGHGGLCMSGPEAQEKYYRNKNPWNKNKCSNGIGNGNNSAVYTFEPPPELEAIGCYKDKIHNRAMPDFYANFRPQVNWSDLYETILRCAFVARDKGYEVFGVQFYGECRSSSNATDTYAKHGVQTNANMCLANIGGPNTNFVYRIHPQVQAKA